MRDKVDSGKIAGILNGFCYMGSTASAYGLGAIADNGGWDAAFYLLLGTCAVGIVAGLVYIICTKFKKKA
jgi:sugar phosphate permease